MSAAGGAPRARLVWVTVLASLWFALVFFVALPAAVLGLSGESLLPPGGPTLAAGLALVAEHCRVHGGRAWVEAGPEGGARFVAEFATR